MQSERAAGLAAALRRGSGAALLAAAALLPVGCGGGGAGGDSGTTAATAVGPPTAGATLANSGPEAASAAQAVASGADAMVNQAQAMNGVTALFGAPVGTLGVPAGDAHALAAAAPAVRPLALQAVTCSDFVDPPCSGSVTMDTSFAASATAVGVGDYADIRFSQVSGTLLGHATVLNGRLRIDFLSAINLNSSQFSGLSLLLTLDGFGGSYSGATFGPISQVAQLQIDSSGVGTLVADGASYSGLGGVSVSAGGTYAISSGHVRVAYWGNSVNYVDLTLTNWRVVAGRPQVGSTAVVGAASGSVTLRVTASSQGSVAYAVAVTAAGNTANYTVTASYPANGGSPSYTAVRS